MVCQLGCRNVTTGTPLSTTVRAAFAEHLMQDLMPWSLGSGLESHQRHALSRWLFLGRSFVASEGATRQAHFTVRDVLSKTVAGSASGAVFGASVVEGCPFERSLLGISRPMSSSYATDVPRVGEITHRWV